MFENGLVFRDTALVNYCPSCKVVLPTRTARAEKCDICHSDIVQKSKDSMVSADHRVCRQASGRTGYGGLPSEYPPAAGELDRKIDRRFCGFQAFRQGRQLQIYTTRPDTLFGVTFMVIAPEHPLIDKYASEIKNMDAIQAYREECAKKTEFERTQLVKDKTGVRIEGHCGFSSAHRKGYSNLHRRLCYDGLWYRRNHGGTGARRPRL